MLSKANFFIKFVLDYIRTKVVQNKINNNVFRTNDKKAKNLVIQANIT